MQDSHQLDIWHRAMALAVQVYQFSASWGIPLTQLGPSLSKVSVDALLDEGHQVSRMIHAFIQRLGPVTTGAPDRETHDS